MNQVELLLTFKIMNTNIKTNSTQSIHINILNGLDRSLNEYKICQCTGVLSFVFNVIITFNTKQDTEIKPTVKRGFSLEKGLQISFRTYWQWCIRTQHQTYTNYMSASTMYIDIHFMYLEKWKNLQYPSAWCIVSLVLYSISGDSF